MLLELCTLALGTSLLLYCLLAGADFGAGMLEAFRGTRLQKEQRQLISHALAPVWEANHVWLILAVVCLWNGFPRAFGQLCTTFHIPLTLMLLGVILRGCAFTFRHYDAVRDGSQTYYSAIFVVSSYLTPFWLGVVAGGLLLGRVDLQASDFGAAYVAPWLNLFCLATGGFLCALLAFLAAVYLCGEARDAELRALLRRRARACNLAAVLLGGLVFVGAEVDGLPLLRRFLAQPWSLACMGLATLLLAPLWMLLARQRSWLVRVLAGAQVALVLLGWFALQAPVLIAAHAGPVPAPLTLQGTAAPEPTQRALLWALAVGAALIGPSLLYLLKVFKGENKNGDGPPVAAEDRLH